MKTFYQITENGEMLMEVEKYAKYTEYEYL